MKKYFKYIIVFTLGALIMYSCVYANNLINSNNVSYQGTNETITDVQSAIDDLYVKVDGKYLEGYNAGYNEGMQRFLDENACDIADGTVVHNSAYGGQTAYNFECSGTYLIEYAGARGGSGAGYSMGTSGSGGQASGSNAPAYKVEAEFFKGQLVSYTAGQVGGNASEIYAGTGGQMGGQNGGSGGRPYEDEAGWAICQGGGGGGGGYTLIYIDGLAKFSANGGAGGAGGRYSGVRCDASGSGGAGGSASADSSGYTIVGNGSNNSNGYVRITLVEAKYRR